MVMDLVIIPFSSFEKWEEWLAKNHASSPGIWLQLFKKNSGKASLTYAEALDSALCYGWIDGQKKSYDTHSWLQRFTPRDPKSAWSKINTLHAERLIKLGRMKALGLQKVEEAKYDGRWAKAYEGQSTAALPEDFQKLLSENKKAQAFYDTLNKVNKYAIIYRLQSAKKPETREKRIKDFLAMLQRGEKIYP